MFDDLQSNAVLPACGLSMMLVVGRQRASDGGTPSRLMVKHSSRGALGYVFAVNGQSERAIQLLNSMTKPTKRRLDDEPYSVALILIGLKENQKAVHWLEQSYRGGPFWSLGFRSDPILESLRNDPHFRQFISKVSYPAAVNADPHLGVVG